jgi:hypothetical protein
MTTLASVVINKAVAVLNDAGATRWTSAELLDWLNDAQREIVTATPDAYTLTGNHTLVAGTKQTLPTGAIALTNVVRNMGVGGATPAEAPRRVSMQQLNSHRPSWNSDTTALAVKNWVYDANAPDVFWVWPPMTSATVVELQYSANPTLVASTASNITLDDSYQNPILDYILYRAFSKDIELQAMQARAASHLAAFRASLAVVEKTNEGK